MVQNYLFSIKLLIFFIPFTGGGVLFLSDKEGSQERAIQVTDRAEHHRRSRALPRRKDSHQMCRGHRGRDIAGKMLTLCTTTGQPPATSSGFPAE